MVELWLDSGSPEEVQEFLNCVSGVTTNPILLKKSGLEPEVALKAIIPIIAQRQLPISIQSERLLWKVNYDHRILKLPVTDFALFRKYADFALSRKYAVPINATAVMTFEQGLMAMTSGASIVSVFWNRIKDAGGDPTWVTRRIKDHAPEGVKVLVGSIRRPDDVGTAVMWGADIVTVPAKILREMATHPQTEKFLRECEAAG